ncbi:7,8-didemethyl-8-hydroxy-5-deazariboflavin synthase CofG [Rhodococcus sp. HNM0569]|nr:7,8-didemethyl-8-hydroxy-5-deazariboflavin synthase CofG [Rhodococcus sp. HNM0569]
MVHDRAVMSDGSGAPTILPVPAMPPTPDMRRSGGRAGQRPDAARVRAALDRAADAHALTLDDTTTLLQVQGDDLAELCALAARVRDEGLDAAGRPRTISYSRKVFVPLTRLCRDRCHYCTFVTVPGKLRAAGQGMYLEAEEVLDIARRGAESGCREALFTLGDRPEARWPEAARWLADRGYASTLDYVRAMAQLVLEDTGLLPHLNPGVMSYEELSVLKPYAPSMGMMLETTSRRLFTDRGEAHYGSPDKDPAVRLRTLADAGRLAIPFTTGVLVGIGETVAERADSILAIRDIHAEYGHVQEVIVQNFLAKPDTAMRDAPDAELGEFLAAVAVTRLVMGPDVRVQSPPNLVSTRECLALLGAGVDDWGGVSPLTPDHVNPERPWPDLEVLESITAEGGYTLVERTAAQPRYVLEGEPWLDPHIVPYVEALSSPTTGLARTDVLPSGRPWARVS